ncbi:MAG: 3TM-type holin, partial [Rhodobacterales bacterium]
PDGFAARMTGLNQVPEPLWWLLGAIVGFYCGAREAHHVRARAPASGTPVAAGPARRPRQPSRGRGAAPKASAPEDEPNAALDDWRRSLAVPPTAGAPEAS